MVVLASQSSPQSPAGEAQSQPVPVGTLSQGSQQNAALGSIGGNANGGGDSSSPYQQPTQQQHGASGGFAPAATMYQPGYSPMPQQGMRRRHMSDQQYSGNGSKLSGGHHLGDHDDKKRSALGGTVKRLDLFPKTERDMTVKTDHGGIVTLVGYLLIVILVLAETWTWLGQNADTTEHVVVDTSLGKRMRVNINITFPNLACVDLHVDVMDVAGDSQLNVNDTLVKRRLRLNGQPLTDEEIKVEPNIHKAKQDEKAKILEDEGLPSDYCGPCYGAHETEDQCCNTCEEVRAAYRKKRWNHDALERSAEQCIREANGKEPEPKRMSRGEGCNLSGYMSVSRVAGNFHIAMGEGVEREGRHIHKFVPEDAVNFNASHTIHELSFGPKYSVLEAGGLEGVRKVTTKDTGTTGLFQYFIKVVPTAYKGKRMLKLLSEKPEREEAAETDGEPYLETNRYFFTERFRPLMTEMIDDEHIELGGESDKVAGAHVGGKTGGSHNHHEHHKVQNSVLPGVFFVYEIYPFAVEVTRDSVPFTHLLIRLMATVGGVITIMGWTDAVFSVRDRRRSKS